MSGKYKRNKNKTKEDIQKAINEVGEFDTQEMRNIMNLDIKIKAKFKNEKQKELSKIIEENRITFVTGSPGSGKSFLALKTGIELIKKVETTKLKKILLTTPIIEVSNKTVGILPGDLDMKINHYFQHFYDNINKIIDPRATKVLKGAGLIEEKIVNFIRGTTFGEHDEDGNPLGIYCILDECQNLYPNELKTYISRLGENSKMIILGDIEQCDLKLKRNEKNALEDAISRFKGMDDIGFMEFTEDDIVRDPFLVKVMKRYKD